MKKSSKKGLKIAAITVGRMALGGRRRVRHIQNKEPHRLEKV